MEVDRQELRSTAWRDFDLSAVRERFRAKSPYGYLADRLEVETRRYLFLCASCMETLAPSDIVDEFWHAMILNSQTYAQYCQAAFGKFLHHAAGIPSSTVARREEARGEYLNSLRAYRATFGEPPSDLWPPITDIGAERLKRYGKPHRIHLETTNHCNLHCEHCYPESTDKNPHHALETLLRVLDEAKRKGVTKVTLTGGEILTRPDWQEVVKRALDVCDNLYFISNGLLLTDRKLAWLARQKAYRSMRAFWKSFVAMRPVEIGVAISLDGLKGNELVRKNSAGAAVKASTILKQIEKAVKYGLQVTVNTSITNELTARELPEMYDVLSGMGIDRWQIDHAYPAGRYMKSGLRPWVLGSLDEAKQSFKYIVTKYLEKYPTLPKWRLEIVGVFRWDQVLSGYSPAKSLHDHPCDYHFGSVIVEKGDEVRFCPSLRTMEIGRIGTQDLDSAYRTSREFEEFLNKSINDLPCRDCRYGRLFHGGCRANSYAIAGKLWDRDPLCCTLSPFVEDEIVPLLPRHLQTQFFASLQGGPRPGDPMHPSTRSRQIIPIVKAA